PPRTTVGARRADAGDPERRGDRRRRVSIQPSPDRRTRIGGAGEARLTGSDVRLAGLVSRSPLAQPPARGPRQRRVPLRPAPRSDDLAIAPAAPPQTPRRPR